MVSNLSTFVCPLYQLANSKNALLWTHRRTLTTTSSAMVLNTHTAPDPAISSLSIAASEQPSGPSSSNTPIRQPMTHARVPVSDLYLHCRCGTPNRRPALFPHRVPANQTRHARPTRADIHNHTENNITNGQLQRSHVGASDSNAKAVGERAVSFSMERE